MDKMMMLQKTLRCIAYVPLRLARFRAALSVVVLLILAACGDRACIEADDWGYPKITVDSHYDEASIKGSGNGDPQIVPAIDSGQILLGSNSIPLVMSVSDGDQWSSWFGGDPVPFEVDGLDEAMSWDAKEMVPNKECPYKVNTSYVGINELEGVEGIFTEVHDHRTRRGDDPGPQISKGRLYKGETQRVEDQMACPAPGVVIHNYDMFADCRVPCYMRDGMGLYVALAHNNGNESDIVVTRHIPDAKFPEKPYDITKTHQQNKAMPNLDAAGVVEVDEQGNIVGGRGMDGYLVRGLPSAEIPGAFTRDRLFFKILDYYYTDNYGHYEVRIKEGTRSPNKGPIERIVSTIIDPMMDTMRRLWDGVTLSSDFLQILRAVMALSVMFYAFAFMLGMIQQPKTDFIVNLVRLGIVAQLLSPDSFEFFYNNFFKGFLEGIAEIIALLVTPFSDYDPSSPWYSLDQLLAKLWSMETHAKVWSTLFSNAIGFLFIIAFYIGLIVFLIAVIKALIIYIISIISTAILVVIGPIFIMLMLYGKTRELFEEWISQFVAFAIELILLFAAVGIFAAIIVYFMEQLLGYRVCWNTWWKLDIFGSELFNFKFWLPDIRISNDFMGPIWMDANGDGTRGINEYAVRYFDLPYLDPIHDKHTISRFASEKNFLSLGIVLLLIAIIFLMYSFLEFVPMFANGMKGTSPSASANAASSMGLAWGAIQAVTIGTKGSAGKEDGAMRKNAGVLAGFFYNRTGRDGGLLGGGLRGIGSIIGAGQSAYRGKLLSSIFKSIKSSVSSQKPRETGILDIFRDASDQSRQGVNDAKNFSTNLDDPGMPDPSPALNPHGSTPRSSTTTQTGSWSGPDDQSGAQPRSGIDDDLGRQQSEDDQRRLQEINLAERELERRQRQLEYLQQLRAAIATGDITQHPLYQSLSNQYSGADLDFVRQQLQSNPGLTSGQIIRLVAERNGQARSGATPPPGTGD